MTVRLRPDPHRPTLGEEIANSVSHGVGFLGAVAVAPVLVVHSVRRGDAGLLVGTGVFAATILVLYLASTLYHAMPWGRGKRVFQLIDHGAIYLLIAGTYTPFTIGVMRGPWGWTLFGIVWGLAILGIVAKAISHVRRPILSTVVYLGMGWLVLIAAKPVVAAVPAVSIRWLIAGGLAYTLGIAFYGAHRVRYAHFVWHLFVIAGTACHVAAVLTATA